MIKYTWIVAILVNVYIKIICYHKETYLSITAVFCNDITDPEALPAANITYGSKVQKTCIRRNQDILVLERTCGYDHFLREYRTIGDSFICPGN